MLLERFTDIWQVFDCFLTDVITCFLHTPATIFNFWNHFDDLGSLMRVHYPKYAILDIKFWKILVVHAFTFCKNMSWCICTIVCTVAVHSFTNDISYCSKLNKFKIWYFDAKFSFCFAHIGRYWNILVVQMYMHIS